MSKIIIGKKPNFGLWGGEIQDVDPRDYRRGNFSDLWLGTREKRWQFIGIYGRDVIAGMAVVDASYVGNIFCYVYDKKSGKLWEQERLAPMAMGIRVDRNVAQGISSYQAADERVRFDNRIDQGKRMIDVKLKTNGYDVDIRLDIHDDGKKTTPLQVVTPTAENDFTFTHKSAGLPVLGTLRLGTHQWQLDPAHDFAAIDYTFGYPARETRWNWASMAGHAQCGTLIGLNLVNPIFDPQHNENVFWVNGQRIKVGACDFHYNPDDIMQPWRMKSQDGRVDLQFTPKGIRQQDINYMLIASQFKQPFGLYTGTLKDEQGKVYQISDVLGVVEEHFARW